MRDLQKNGAKKYFLNFSIYAKLFAKIYDYNSERTKRRIGYDETFADGALRSCLRAVLG